MSSENIPQWLNAGLFESILRIEEPGADISIRKCDVSKAGMKGGGYLSELNRAVVEYECKNQTKRLCLIIKTPPANYHQFEFGTRINAFHKEITLYQKTLPAMYRLMNPKTRFQFAPKCLICPRPDTLVLEDLSESGFLLGDRRVGLDFDHSVLVVKTVAKFHAMSVILHREDPKSMEHYEETHYTKSMQGLVDAFMNQTFEALILNVGKWEGYERFVCKLENLAEKATEIMQSQIQPREESVCVLNHGDLWVNNILFKYCQNTEAVEDVRFIDFQHGRFTSPVIDLHHFFCLSLQEEVFFHRLDELVEEYHKTFSQRLEDHGYERNFISLPKLKKELEDTQLFAAVTSFSKLWFVLIDPKDVDDVQLPNKFVRGQGQVNTLTKVYSDLLMRKAFEKLLPYFEAKGIL